MKKRLLILLMLAFGSALSAYAEDALCATVEIEIQQELTLERQAFDARMKINNGLDGINLTDVQVVIHITDEDGGNINAAEITQLNAATDALFFIQDPSFEGSISSLPGTIAGGTSAEMNWMLIPAVGASDDNPNGKMYYVGATLTYMLQGKMETVEVAPDYIFVKPMPYLELDYFIPEYVYGDNGFTDEIEPTIPFPLGLRIRNAGFGAAHNVKIDSGQPEIVTNELGLLVGFSIEGSAVHGEPRTPSLLLDFGGFEPFESKMGYWEMTSSLAGLFRDFKAKISHADELGGQVTSLIHKTNVNTHVHIKDVVVDLPDRDRVVDFLTDGMVYESEGDNVPASSLGGNLSMATPVSTFSFSGSTNGTHDYVYSTINSPFGTSTENYAIKRVVRSDGKVMHESNVWLSKEGPPHVNDGNWHHYFNIFDVNGPGYSYSVELMDISDVNDPPVIRYMKDRTVAPGIDIGFVVLASDDGGVPSLTCVNLPTGASFEIDPQNTGVANGTFLWTPQEVHAGRDYLVKFVADDGELSSFRNVRLTVSGDALTVGELYPSWWTDRGVINLNAETNDYAAVNAGQLKHVASMAWDEFNLLPIGAPAAEFVSSNDYVVVNVGQVKSAAAQFYDQMGMTNNYPWGTAVAGSNDYALANIGQVKGAFNFEPHKDSDLDGLPDWWEKLYSDSETGMDAAASYDGDEHSNLYEYLNNLNPTVKD